MTSTFMKTPITFLGNGLGLAAMLAGGLAHAVVFTFDPDTPGINDGDNISTFFPAAQFFARPSGGGGDAPVYATSHGAAPTGSLVFGWDNGGFLDGHWGRSNAPDLFVVFSIPANQVSIDYFSDVGIVTLQAFDSGNNLLGTSTGTPDFFPQTLTLSTGGPDLIQSVLVSVSRSPGADFGLLDHLVMYSSIPEPRQTAILAALGLAGLVGWRRLKRRA